MNALAGQTAKTFKLVTKTGANGKLVIDKANSQPIPDGVTTTEVNSIVAEVYAENGTKMENQTCYYFKGDSATGGAGSADKAAQAVAKNSILNDLGIDESKLTGDVRDAWDDLGIESMTAAEVIAFMNSTAYQTAIQNMKNAMTAAEKTWLKLASGSFGSDKAFTGATTVVNNLTVNLGSADSDKVAVSANVTVNVVPKTGTVGEYKFTATKTGTTNEISANATVTVPATNPLASYPVVFEDLTAGTWAISCEKVETTPRTVTITNSDPACTITTADGNAFGAGVELTPGSSLTFSVVAPTGYKVLSVGSAEQNTGDTWTYTMPLSTTGDVTLAITLKLEYVNVDANSTRIVPGTTNNLTANASLNSVQTISDNTTINLNGKVLTVAPTDATKSAIKVESGKTLTIEGGTLNINNKGAGGSNNIGIEVVGSGKVVLKNVDIVSTGSGTIGVCSTNGDPSVATTIEITGGSIRTTGAGGVGVQTHGNGAANVTLTDVTVTTDGDDAVYMPGKDNVTITGCTLTGAVFNGVEVRGGTLNMKDTTVEVKNATSITTTGTPAGGGSNVKGAALSVNPYNRHDVNVTAENCTFISTNTESKVVYVGLLESAVVGDSSVTLTKCKVGNVALAEGNVVTSDNLTANDISIKIDNKTVNAGA